MPRGPWVDPTDVDRIIDHGSPLRFPWRQRVQERARRAAERAVTNVMSDVLEMLTPEVDNYSGEAHTACMPTRTTPTRTARLALEDQALALREQGMTYTQIAAEMGVYAQIANTYVRRALSRQNLVVRSFGVEIELKGLTPYAAANALRAAGLIAYDEGYNHDARPHWKCVLDGSVSGGCEVVSPILSGEQGLADVVVAMNALRNAGATVDTACGMHVHLDARDLTGDEFARIFGFYTERQDLFDSMVAPSRRNNQYARKYSASEIGYIKDAARADKNSVGRAASTRYVTVNVQSYGRHGTIEFRQHQGTLNGTKATAWVRMLLAIACKVQATAEETISATDAAEMIDGLGLPAEVAAYLKARATRLAV